MEQQKLPVGTDDFVKLRQEDLYYVDKTGLIKELLGTWSEVSLFTRPRRFGKSLNMSMLKCFFEIGTDNSLFDGLAISKEIELCEKHMGQYPVISISLKNVDGIDFEMACTQMWKVIRKEARRFAFLEKSNKLDAGDKGDLQSLRDGTGNLDSSIELLSSLLYRHYDKKVIILIDEYDVPLDKSFHRGYYDEMILLIRQIFGYALKSNESLQFAVLTGCLRVSKESIFTGLNNMKVLSITDERYDEWFGFTDSEVRKMLETYGLSEHYQITKEWYNGYKFGKTDVYCPWDVINWCDLLMHTKKPEPQDFWANTSSNDMVRRFVNQADRRTQEDIEKLIAGGSITKQLRLDLTYVEIERNIDNLWSVLFTTGYLTQCGKDDKGNYNLIIPNREIEDIFILQIQEWFNEKVQSDAKGAQQFCTAFENGDTSGIERYLNNCMAKSISIQDTKVRKDQKENFYHGLLIGLLNNRGTEWTVVSNREAGNGFADIIVYRREDSYGFVIEVKYADCVAALEQRAQDALDQLVEMQYEQFLINEGIKKITSYGIAFSRKNCKVLKK